MHRLKLLHPLLSKYKRRFTILDLGSGDGSLSCAIADQYDAVVIAVEKDPSTYPPYRTDGNLIYLTKEMSPADLWKWSECERFDVVLAFNFIHWFDAYTHALLAIMKLGDHVFVQIPYSDEAKVPHAKLLPKMHGIIQSLDGAKLGETAQFPGHNPRPIYQLEGMYARLVRTGWTSHKWSADTIFESNFEKRTAVMRRFNRGPKDWIPGINLSNFLYLKGIRPTIPEIRKMMERIPLSKDHPHGDIAVHNMILDGKKVSLIDGYDGWGNEDDKASLARAIERLENFKDDSQATMEDQCGERPEEVRMAVDQSGCEPQVGAGCVLPDGKDAV